MDPGNSPVLLMSARQDAYVRGLLKDAGQLEAFDDQHIVQLLTLHPSGSLRVYVKKDLWEEYLNRFSSEPPPVIQK